MGSTIGCFLLNCILTTVFSSTPMTQFLSLHFLSETFFWEVCVVFGFGTFEWYNLVSRLRKVGDTFRVSNVDKHGQGWNSKCWCSGDETLWFIVLATWIRSFIATCTDWWCSQVFPNVANHCQSGFCSPIWSKFQFIKHFLLHMSLITLICLL